MAGALITEDYEMEYNGLLIGGDTPFGIAQIDGLIDLPDLSTGDVPYAGRHGMAAGYDWMRGRSIRLTIEVYGDTDAELSARFNELTAAFAPAHDELPLVFQIPGIAGGGKAQVDARVRRRSGSIDRQWYYRIPVVVIELFCTSPYLFANDAASGLISATLPIYEVSGGAEFDATFDLGFGTVGTSGTAMLSNTGSADTAPTVTFTGPVTNPTITNLSTSESWGYDGTVASGDTLTVDMGARTVLVNGSVNRYYLTASGSTFWELPVGDSTVRYTADAVTASTATITARSAWV